MVVRKEVVAWAQFVCITHHVQQQQQHLVVVVVVVVVVVPYLPRNLLVHLSKMLIE